MVVSVFLRASEKGSFMSLMDSIYSHLSNQPISELQETFSKHDVSPLQLDMCLAGGCRDTVFQLSYG